MKKQLFPHRLDVQRNSSAGFSVRDGLIILGIVAIVGVFVATSGSSSTALEQIREKYSTIPTYSVVLSDAKEDGNYYQKLTTVVEDKALESDWLETTEENFTNTLPFLGMTIFSKKDGVGTDEAAPPGYEKVGDPKYGSWQTNNTGGSFWVFYGQYRLMSDLLGWGRVSRNDYNAYQNNRAMGKPYYGSNNQFGLNGAQTKQKHPSFYQRSNSAQMAKKASFSNKVNNRIGRTSTPVRSRSGGVGK